MEESQGHFASPEVQREDSRDERLSWGLPNRLHPIQPESSQSENLSFSLAFSDFFGEQESSVPTQTPQTVESNSSHAQFRPRLNDLETTNMWKWKKVSTYKLPWMNLHEALYRIQSKLCRHNHRTSYQCQYINHSKGTVFN